MSTIQTASIIGNQAARYITAALLTCALPVSTWAADWTLGASVTASETYTDNVALSQASNAKSDFITAVTPTFTAKKDGARLKVDANYSNQNLIYAADSTRNTTHHQLSARANMELIENEFFIDTTASISQAAISPLAATGVDNTNATGNISSVRALNFSPYWVHRFGSAATLNARYTVSDVGNSDSTLSDSGIGTVNIALTSGTDFGRLSWGLNYSDQTVDYQDRSDVGFTTASASLGYLFSPRLKLTMTLGTENNQYEAPTGAKTGGAFWNTTIGWAPSTRTSVDFGFGHHYFGNTWNLAFKTRGAYSEWTANYDETVTASNSQLASSSGTYVTSLLLNGIPVKKIDEGTFSTSALTNQVYLNKRFTTTFRVKKGRSDLSLSANRSIQTTKIETNSSLTSQSSVTGGTGFLGATNDVFLTTSEIKQIGATAGWRWQWTALTNTNLSLSLNRYDYSGISRRDNAYSLQVGLDRKFSPKLTGNLSLRHQSRDSNQGGDFSENALSGALTYSF